MKCAHLFDFSFHKIRYLYRETTNIFSNDVIEISNTGIRTCIRESRGEIMRISHFGNVNVHRLPSVRRKLARRSRGT